MKVMYAGKARMVWKNMVADLCYVFWEWGVEFNKMYRNL